MTDVFHPPPTNPGATRLGVFCWPRYMKFYALRAGAFFSSVSPLVGGSKPLTLSAVPNILVGVSMPGLHGELVNVDALK
jgi:hypothetical protein